jgi:hypothetical protein
MLKTQGKVWIIYDAETKVQTKPMSVVQAQVTLLQLVASNPNRYFIWTPGWDGWVCVQEFLDSDQKYFVIVQPPKPDEPAVKLETVTITVTQNAPATDNADSMYTQVVVGETPMKDAVVEEYWRQDFNGDQLDIKKIAGKKKPETTKKKVGEHTVTNAKISLKDPKDSKEPSKPSDRRRDPRHNFKIEVVLVSIVRSFRTYSRNISLSGTMLEDEIPKDFLNKPFDLIITNPFEPDPSKARLLFRAKIVGDLVDARRLMFIEQDVAMTLRLDALLKAYVAYQAQMRRTA